MKRIALFLAFFATVTVLASAQSAKVVTAYNHLTHGEYVQAKNAINEAILDSKTGNQAKTWYYRGAIYEALYVDTALRSKNPDALPESIRSYKKAMELDPKNQWKSEIQQGLNNTGMYIFNEGVAPYNAKNYPVAYSNFKEAAGVYVYLNTTFAQAVVDTYATLYTGHASLKMKKYDDALANYQVLISKGIKLPELYQNMSEAYVGLGDTVKAKETVAEGVKTFPNDKGLMVQELNMYLFTRDYDVAIEKLNAAIAKDSNFTALYIQLGNLYDQKKDTTNARKAYEEALSRDPANFDALYRLGAFYYNQAVDLNNQMNKLDLNQQKQYDLLKVKRDENFKKALPYLEKANQIDGNDLDTLSALKELYARLGQMDKSNEVKMKIESLKG